MMANKMKLFNLHTHTHYCDGSEEPEAYIRKALELEFSTLGFSGHAPMPFKNKYAIDADQLSNYISEINQLKSKYKDQIDVLCSLEFDYIPRITDDFKQITENFQLEYTIGSVHLVRNENDENLWFIDGKSHEPYDTGLKDYYGGNIKHAVKNYFGQLNEMIDTQRPDIIGHLDKIKMHNRNRYFTENEVWYQNEIDQTLDLIKSSNTIVEVNTRGLYKKRSDSLFPGAKILKKMKKLHIPITVSSDAHKPGELALFIPETINLLREIGFKKLMNFKNGWIEIPI